jgi:hypothetical protein
MLQLDGREARDLDFLKRDWDVGSEVECREDGIL